MDKKLNLTTPEFNSLFSEQDDIPTIIVGDHTPAKLADVVNAMYNPTVKVFMRIHDELVPVPPVASIKLAAGSDPQDAVIGYYRNGIRLETPLSELVVHSATEELNIFSLTDKFMRRNDPLPTKVRIADAIQLGYNLARMEERS